MKSRRPAILGAVLALLPAAACRVGAGGGGADPCAVVTCSGHGTCSAAAGVATCGCEGGYHADGLTCAPDASVPTVIGGVAVMLTGGSQPVPVPFPTWTDAAVAVSPSTTGRTFYVDGGVAASGDGTALATAFQTVAEGVAVLAAGDTLLIRAGLYREAIDLSRVSGASGAPVTLGALGDGRVVLDSSPRVSGWTPVSAGSSVYQATLAGGQVDGVVIDGVPLVRTQATTAAIAPGSGQWFQDGTTLVADFGTTTPGAADVVVPVYSHAAYTIFIGASSWLNLIGLTVRGSGWSGIWSYANSPTDGGHHVNVAWCDLSFNVGSGLTFMGGSDNAALYNRVHHDVLDNWPFCSNGHCVAGGGWPGGLAWGGEANPVARGNVVSLNGGEGIISYMNGTANGQPTGNTLIEENVSYDNWSMNVYVDNQPNHTIRGNLLFRHAPSAAWMWDPSDAYDAEKFRTCLGLADEYASGSPAGTASLANVRVYDNLLLGCRFGIADYAESTTGHGMKHDLIVNNTIVMDAAAYSVENTAGIVIGANGASDTGTLIASNLVVRPVGCGASACPLVATQGAAPLGGIALESNLYFARGSSAAAGDLFVTNSATSPAAATFAAWQGLQQQDLTSLYADPVLADLDALQPPGATPVDYSDATVGAASPARGLAVPRPSLFTTDFAGASRGSSWTAGALQ